MQFEKISVEPDRTAKQLREYARTNPHLRKGPYGGPENSVDGHCYWLSESYFHASGGRASGLDIYCLSWREVDPSYGGTHWFLRRRRDRAVVDLGLESPDQGQQIPFDDARRRSFITGYDNPSKRTKRVLDALDFEY